MVGRHIGPGRSGRSRILRNRQRTLRAPEYGLHDQDQCGRAAPYVEHPTAPPRMGLRAGLASAASNPLCRVEKQHVDRNRLRIVTASLPDNFRQRARGTGSSPVRAASRRQRVAITRHARRPGARQQEPPISVRYSTRSRPMSRPVICQAREIRPIEHRQGQTPRSAVPGRTGAAIALWPKRAKAGIHSLLPHVFTDDAAGPGDHVGTFSGVQHGTRVARGLVTRRCGEHQRGGFPPLNLHRPFVPRTACDRMRCQDLKVLLGSLGVNSIMTAPENRAEPTGAIAVRPRRRLILGLCSIAE